MNMRMFSTSHIFIIIYWKFYQRDKLKQLIKLIKIGWPTIEDKTIASNVRVVS